MPSSGIACDGVFCRVALGDVDPQRPRSGSGRTLVSAAGALGPSVVPADGAGRLGGAVGSQGRESGSASRPPAAGGTIILRALLRSTG